MVRQLTRTANKRERGRRDGWLRVGDSAKVRKLEATAAVNRHAKYPLGVEWESWSEERERVRVRLRIVDTWWTKKDPFAAVFEGEVIRRRLRQSLITVRRDTALACLTLSLTSCLRFS
eukprot:scaffold14972_cov52-Cyclotella_meneghiniana.AAC.3